MRKIIFLFLLIVNTAVAQVPEGNCHLAQSRLNIGLEAGKRGEWQKASKRLLQAINLCSGFKAWYLLGRTYIELAEDDKALLAFEGARRYARNDDQKALSIARYAEVLAMRGQIDQSLTLIHEAKRLHSDSPNWMVALSRKLDLQRTDRVSIVVEITDALDNKSIRLLGGEVKPNINISINFEYNSTNIVGNSKQAIDVLVEAFAQKALIDKTITIIGHADKRGTGVFNQKLSEDRAKHIAKLLINKQPTLKKRLKTHGMGEQNLLYFGNSEEDHLLNRRIEFQVE